ncbi:MAG: hypothetical protein PHX37_05655, partial [Eubacteriales bacterium]|nr:hypothetical protein [Eubacteriales bacterium]
FRMRLARFFQGRYGSGALNIFLIVAALILSQFRWVYLLGYLMMIAAIFRMLSKNIFKRQRELAIYNKVIGTRIKTLYYKASSAITKGSRSLRIKYAALVKRQQDRKYYRFIRCKACKSMMRVPKNKGKVKITCPVCGLETTRKV